MRKLSVILLSATVTLLTTALASFAQPRPGMMWRGSGGWGPGTAYNKMYDPKTVETVSGEVASIDRITPNKGMTPGIHMNVKTDKETISVHLGPVWYIENQDVKIAPKDKIEVKGSRVTFGGKPVIIAAEVKKGDEVLQLRDESGFPVWSGWRRR
ncbi:MAG TPA: DNA-binding protein [Candidatus Binatia bacterium]|nr:DNA-binding protein [Candidatus Binatia bacterium]